ncbi:MAG: YggS family pyridoxal phosphate-dependent enzyme [Bacteroidota bacterium]
MSTVAKAEVYGLIQAEVERAKARLIAVSKTHPKEKITAFYALGHRDFGENRVNELVDKQASLPSDINWHFIGHLQRNKVKYIAPFVHLIHAVDSLRLLREIDKQGQNNDRVIDVLLQFHIAQESNKYGLDWSEAAAILSDIQETPLTGARIVGVMGMATYTDHDEQIAAEFDELVSYYNRLKNSHFSANSYFKEISMGMSGDYPLALQKGSTMVRVGSLLFGERG